MPRSPARAHRPCSHGHSRTPRPSDARGTAAETRTASLRSDAVVCTLRVSWSTAVTPARAGYPPQVRRSDPVTPPGRRPPCLVSA